MKSKKSTKPVNMFSKTMEKGETKAMDKKALSAAKKAYNTSEMKSLKMKKK